MSEELGEVTQEPSQEPESTHEPVYITQENQGGGTDVVAIIAIIGVVIVALACVASCAVVTVAFLNNPPW